MAPDDERDDARAGIAAELGAVNDARLHELAQRVRLATDARLRLVDYSTGAEPDALRQLVQARIVDGAELGRDPGTSVVTLVVWRHASQTQESWARTYHAFRTEVHLIKARVEGLL